MSSFAPAVKAAVPVKIGIVGPSGSGKTYTALRLASGIAGPEGRIAVIDTEHGSALEYADEFKFDHSELNGDYRPANFVVKMDEAEMEGYDVIVVDGISPAWNGPGGVQEIVDRNTKGGNSWSGWAVGTPEHQKLLEGILACKVHLICTMRSKTAWALEENEKGKKMPVKIGLEPVQRDGIDYEFTVMGHLDLAHNMTIVKSRRRAVPVGVVIHEPGEKVGNRLVVMAREDPEAPKRPAEPSPEAAPPAPMPEPVAGPTEPAAVAPDTLPIDPIAAEPEPEPEPTTDAHVQMIEQLDKICSELAQLRPEVNWFDAVNNASMKDYNVQAASMTPEQGAKIIERLKVTLLQAREQKAAAASAS